MRLSGSDETQPIENVNPGENRGPEPSRELSVLPRWAPAFAGVRKEAAPHSKAANRPAGERVPPEPESRRCRPTTACIGNSA